MVQFVVRITSSLALLVAAIYIHQYLETTEFLKYLTIALLAFFVGEGPIYSLEKSTDRIENEGYLDNSTRQSAIIIAIILHYLAVGVGCIFLIIACFNLMI